MNSKIILILLITMLTIGTLTQPFRYESGFKLWQYDIDLYGKNITNGSVFMPSYPIKNVNTNYSVSADNDYALVVDATTQNLNLSFEHPGNQSMMNNSNSTGGREYKIILISANTVTLQSARVFIGNTSNSSEKFNGNIFYYNFTADRTYNLTQMAINLYSKGTGCCIRLAIYNTSSDGLLPYRLLDQSANITTVTSGWNQVTGFNKTVVLQPTVKYWIAFQTNDSTIVPYAAGNKTSPTSHIVYNQGYAYSTFNITANQLSNNATVGQLVPNIAINMAVIDNGYTKVLSTQYGAKFIQTDGSKWWS